MPELKPAETRTALAEDTAKLKPSTDVARIQGEDTTNEATANSPTLAVYKPEVISPAKPTSSSVLATNRNEGIIAKGDLPLFFAQQPEDRAIPAPSPEEYEAIKANVREVGRIREPILITPSGIVIDGYTRLQIAIDLDIPCPWTVEHIADDQVRSLARTIALARRTLTVDQKRQLIADELVEDAEAAKLGEDRRSFNTIAKKLGVACGTVISVSRKLIERGDIPAITESVGADGKVRRARKHRNSDTGLDAGPETAPTPPSVDSATTAPAPADNDIASPASAPFTAAAETVASAVSETPGVQGRGATMTSTVMGAEPLPGNPIDSAKDVEPGLDDSEVEDDGLASPAKVTTPRSEPARQAATELSRDYVPGEHPLTEAVRVIFRSPIPDSARVTVDRLMAIPPSKVTLDEVDAVLVRCGLGKFTFVVPHETLSIGSA